MQNILRNTPDSRLSPWMFLLILGGYVMAGLFVFQLVGPLFALPFYDFDLMKTLDVISNPTAYSSSRVPLLVVQGVISIGTFVLVPWWIVRRYLRVPIQDFFTLDTRSSAPLALTIFIVFAFMGVNSFFIEWNMQIKLPESLSGLEEWVRAIEDQLKVLTEHLIQFDHPGQFVLGLIVIAIIPGIGEELLFRGLLQNTFNKVFGNPHVAIWLAALLFGMFHLQFYGVVPRILLGALFGYLYYFSGHLGYAMLAHFTNNGFMILMVYLNQIGWIDYDIESMDTQPELWVTLTFAVLTFGLIVVFYKYFKSQADGVSESV